MSEQRPLSLFFNIAALVISISSAFNIDTENPQIYSGKKEDFFGYKVLQFISGNEKGVMVSAPLRQNGSGGVCRCVENKTACSSPEDFSFRNDVGSVKYIGLSMAKGSNRNLTVCSPSLAHECFGNSYLNSMCYQFDDHLQITSHFTPAFQECTNKTVNLVFLFDGSESMTTQDFEKNKGFILDMMARLKNSSIHFAAAQFSTDARTVFNFKDYKEGNASDFLRKEVHMKALTNTYKAINHVLTNLFDIQSAGATTDAIKVLVIITDGEPSENDKKFKSISRSDNKTIIRFIIGVKDVSIQKLQSMASEPKTNNTFHIKDYNGLTGILDNFKKKIFNIEGSKTALAGNLNAEMSQTGFSAIYHKDVLVLGSVGSNSWRGSLYETDSPKLEGKAIHDPKLVSDSYMGYSVAAGEKNKEPIYFTGAPRSNHTGHIVLFIKSNKTWTVKDRKEGDQIGSYFGAELCTMDIDSDSNTDFLLVGAPMFHQPKEMREGQIYVYSLNDKVKLSSKLNVSVPSRGRFGATISSLTDLNGDGLTDVAVGAPLEAEHRGAVYIYLGDKYTGIRPTFSQRILAEAFQSQLQYFGQTLDGKIDLGNDELTDLVIGYRGGVIVLRSRPVLSVSADLRHYPSEISTDNINCVGNMHVLPMVSLTVCFSMAEATRSKAGALDKGLKISYTLDVDPVRKIKRGFLSETGKVARKPPSNVTLTDRQTCFNQSVYMPSCVMDTLSPIVIQLNFSQLDTNSFTGILNVDSNTQAMIEVPFKKNCKQNESCVAELEVDFDFVTSTLIVVDQSYFNLTLTLLNHGDDSYNTSLTLNYPHSLSFSMMFLEKATRSTLYSCNGLEGVLGRTTCAVNLPVYRSGSSAMFKSSFLITSTDNWNDTISIGITAESDNENSTRNVMTKSIPVQYEIDLAVQVHDSSITYLNFTLEDNKPKILDNVYEVKNFGFVTVPVTVSFTIPTALEHTFEMRNYKVSASKNETQCRSTISASLEYCSPDKYCKSIECESFMLEKGSTVQFILSGNAVFRDLKQHAKDLSLTKQFTGDGAEVNLKSFVHLTYNKTRYVQASSEQGDKSNYDHFHRAQIDVRAEFILPPNTKLIVGTGVGGGLLILTLITVCMLKMGCFKRKRPCEEEIDMELTDNTPAEPGKNISNETESQEVKTAEAKPLLDGDQKENVTISNGSEENGSTHQHTDTT